MGRPVLCIFVILLNGLAGLLAQEESTPDLNPQIERMLENLENSEIQQVDFLQQLIDLQNDPIDINRATPTDLLEIPFLNRDQCRAIIDYRQKNGPFTSIEQLRLIPGISDELWEAIAPFLTISRQTEKMQLHHRVRVYRQFPESEAYRSGIYRNPFYLSHRLRWNSGTGFLADLLIEKDAGETQWNDFTSLSLYYRKPASPVQVLLGDFNLQFGQGLLLGPAYGFPVNGESIEQFEYFSNRLWRSHYSSNEAAFLRGGLLGYQPKENWQVMGFFSRRRLDATLDEPENRVKSISLSGLHRTPTELQKQENLTESTNGLFFMRHTPSLELGLGFARISYSLPIEVNNWTSLETFQFLDTFYRYRFSNLHLSGELVLQNHSALAMQHTAWWDFQVVKYGALVYYYHPDFWSFHGRGFGSISQSAGNEQGYYLSFQARPLSRWELSGFLHAHKPVKTLQQFDSPVSAFQLEARTKFRQTTLRLRFVYRENHFSFSNLTAQRQIQRAWRLHWQTEVSSRVRVAQRLELSRVSGYGSLTEKQGISLYVDMRYRWSRGGFLQARLTQFDIPGADYRIYEFENDLPGNFTNVYLNGRGYKWFLFLGWKVSSRFSLYAKYRSLHYPDEKTLGSGYDLIPDNQKREIKIQLEIHY